MKDNYKELKAWQLGIDIVNDVYSIIKNHVNKEKLAEFNIIYQLGKTAEHIPNSLAKTKYIKTYKRLLSYLRIANSASIDLMVKIDLAKHLQEINTVDADRILDKIEELQKLLDLLIRPVEKQVEYSMKSEK